MICQCYFNTEEQLLCEGDLRKIRFSIPISEEQHRALEEKCLCQTHYNCEVVNKNYYQEHQKKLNEYCAYPKHSIYKQSTKKKKQAESKDALINLLVRLYKILELDSTAKICIKFTDKDSNYITSNNYIQATKQSQIS
ncbi:25114_t:CDS:1 [Dentiscutata erythropus]|uniref:25114_t:CDS:1 n=1 Tax=Dentiscutata erythropus TaxID=1348616 RepID=A0A9N9P1I2_9GLOM|nr:25114_t:CDS:1 [Dentiscutata erythropus]